MGRRRLRRRSCATEDENPIIVDAELEKGRFSCIYRGSFQQEIKIKHCIPLFRSRTLCRSAIRGLTKLFDIDESGYIGYSCAGGLKVVVMIPEEELHFVKSYLLETGKSELEATEHAFRQGIVWYGIVDGEHTHQSLSDLEKARPDPFHDFRWLVIVIEWQPIRVLKAFSRARNMLQSANIVEMTLFDTIGGIHDIAHEKAQLAGESFESITKQRGIITEIADEYCGGSNYSRQTIRTLAGAALRIKPESVKVLGEIMTEEDVSLTRRVLERRTSEMPREEDIFDARAFRDIISTNTVRGATTFLNADAVDQVNAITKLKFCYEENGFKCFQASRLNKETERSARARRQVYLMNILMCRDKWPEELAVVEKNLFTSSHFDSELDKYDKNTDTIMPCLITEYLERMPLEAGLRWRLYSEDLARTEATANEAGASDGEDTGECSRSQDNNSPDDSGNNVCEEEDVPIEVCPFEQLNVKPMNLTLERYSLQRKADDEKFHLITGDPTQLQLNGTRKFSIDELQADAYVGIIKQLIVDHGWAFLYTTALDFSMWYKVFRANGFDPLEYPWIMVRDTDTIQSNTSPIPQNVTEMMIAARMKGSGVPEFQPDLTSSYKRPVSSRKRKFAIMDCCAEPRLKLKKPNTREPVRSNQRSPEPIAEFLQTFCPPGGYVLDAFSGTMETVKACFMTGRRCVALEGDKYCFDLAVQNLKESATAYLRQNGLSGTEEVLDLIHTPTLGRPEGETDGERDNRENGMTQRGEQDNGNSIDISLLSDSPSSKGGSEED